MIERRIRAAGRLALHRQRDPAFYAKTLVVPGENLRDWEQLLSEVLEDLNPHGIIANSLAVEIAACFWRIHRIDAAEYASLMRLAKLQVWTGSSKFVSP